MLKDNNTNKEIKEAFLAFCTIDEILSFNGQLDDSKNDAERKAKLEAATKTVESIAKKKGITVRELQQKVLVIVQKILAEKK
jgi:hypothetical protein